MEIMKVVFSIFIIASSNWFTTSGEDNVKVKQKVQSAPASVDSRFFDFGELFNSLLPNFNQNRPGGNVGANLPQTGQFSPTAQGNFPQISNPGNQWENQNQGNLNPPQMQFHPQQPNTQNQWQLPQFSNQGWRPNNPNEFNNSQRPNHFPGNRNPPNWRPEYNGPGSNEYPQQFGPDGLHTQVQLPSQGEIWNQPTPIPNPDQNRPVTLFPGPEYQGPSNNVNNNYPSNNNQVPWRPQGQNFDQGENQGNWQNPVNSDGGTLDDIAPPMNNGSENNAILGKPVVVPSSTANPDQIVFDNSTESPLQRQCVQDCPATPEYNPICGTNNVTYFNSGKFVCARNCGVSVYVARRGVCTRRPM